MERKAGGAEMKEKELKELAKQIAAEDKFEEPIKKKAVVSGKSMNNANKAMSQAMEQMAQDSENRSMPIFSRGPEIEITSMQDVEMLKQLLAKIKVHVPTKVLERGIVMPRDFDNYRPAYPKPQDQYMTNPYKYDDDTKKKGKKKVTEGDLRTARRLYV